MLSDGSRECNCDEIVNRHPQCVCDRKHFNNILWATVTVFQVSHSIFIRFLHTFVTIMTYVVSSINNNNNNNLSSLLKHYM